MEKFKRSDLYSLEQYAELRESFRSRVINHKRYRRLAIGAHASLYFEDRLTIQYQIQEMLRVERIFDKAGIEQELEAYNPLIPDGKNLKATFMLEYGDPDERREQLALLKRVEDCIWMQISGHDAVVPFADEDLERTNDQATSAVHFLRFEFTPAMINDLSSGRDLSAGIDHEFYSFSVAVSEPVRNCLSADFE
ncbi:MAG: DUF3501 family protein [Methylococcales bacterium]|jgi:hypothetical protein|nr:DUF3501 family protein [Methylococcales bacterium]MEE2766696.1 DUF3501 family protein [Pseudomonadota bacterium]